MSATNPGLEADPGRQEWIEQRLAAIETIARKHRCEPLELLTTQADLAAELQRLEGLQASLESIEAKLAEADLRFRSACTKLTAARTTRRW